jgi:iron complex outermembrane receptor protein
MQICFRYLFYGIVFIVVCSKVHSQERDTIRVTGNIMDVSTGKVIAGATVDLSKATDSLFRITGMSDTAGNFYFAGLKEGEYLLTISHTGFSKYAQKIKVQQGRDVLKLRIKMSADKKQLKEVVVTAKKENLLDFQLDKIVVNANALIATAGGNVIDVLNSSPGVLVDENGSVSLKGREGVIIYIDDKPVRVSGADLLNYLKSFPASIIDKIELISNPSSKYNADGSAIINIKTKKIKTQGFNGSLSSSVGYGRYFKSYNGIITNYRINRINFFMNAAFSADNSYFNSQRERVYSYPDIADSYTLLQRVLETNHNRSVNYKFGIDYDLNKFTALGILVDGYANPYNERGLYSNRFIDPSGKQDSSMVSGSGFRNKPFRNSVNMNLKHLFNGARKEININLDYLRYSTQSNQILESNVYKPVDSPAQEYALITANRFAATIYSTKADYSDTIFNNIKTEQGVQTIYSIRDNTSSYLNKVSNELYPDPLLNNSFRYREYIHAAYINLQRNFKRWSAQLGLRLESTTGNALQYNLLSKPDTSFSINYTNLFPTAYLMYKIDTNGKNVVTLSAGRRIERPGYGDLNPSAFYFDKNTSNAGNSLLQPAFSNNIELSYNHNGKFTAGISYTNTRGMITRGYKQVGDAFIGQAINVDRFTLIGTSITWSLNLTRWWIFNIFQEFHHRHYRGKVFNGETYLNESLTTLLLRIYNQFKFNKGWSANFTYRCRSKSLLWQSDMRSSWLMEAGVQKKINERATLSLTGSDIFHSWKTRRNIYIQYAQVYYYLIFDTQKVNLSFRYSFGKSVKSRERKTGIETEAGRVQ